MEIDLEKLIAFVAEKGFRSRDEIKVRFAADGNLYRDFLKAARGRLHEADFEKPDGGGRSTLYYIPPQS